MRSPATDPRARLWTFFAVTWAAAALFHLAGNPRLAPEWGRGLLGAAAVLVLARPRNPWFALPLCGAVLTNVWLEAPLLSNHWLLHGLLAVLVALSILTTRGDPIAAIERLTGPGRLLLLAFYSFAAFAKLNSDFFDPAVSCAYYYLRESADSWGIAAAESLSDGLRQAAAVVVAAIELTIPVLLIVRRTRRVGVIVALAFHFVLALDRSHQFFDFSSILLALFLLFLPASDRLAIDDRWQHLRERAAARWESGPELAGLLGLAAIGGGVVLAAGPGDWPAPNVLREVGVWTWIVLGVATLWLTATVVREESNEPDESLAPGAPAWLLVVPVIAVLNGLTPYTEVKTGYGWNMYANLAIADGESNHLLIRRSLPLTDEQERLVHITATNDRGLEFYVDSQWVLPEVQLEEYLADRPEARVEAVVDDEIVRYEGGGDMPRPLWRQKFQLFRAVDVEAPVSCQPSFGPAR